MSNLAKRVVVLFSYQSQDVRLNEWLELITLCLAPLVIHIVAGVPSPTFLNPKMPRWHQRISLYNPTSIVWRYFAIFDRRIRAKSWNSFDMAASNAIFWTSEGWDGSEGMIQKSRRYCRREPAKKHIDFVSATAAKTLVVALQGIQAIYPLVLGVQSPETNSYGHLVALHYIFFPLTIFGLLRLPVAYWLTEDYDFAHVHTHRMNTDEEGVQSNKFEPTANCETEYCSASLLCIDAKSTQPSFHPANSWRGIATRILFLAMLLPLCGITAYYISTLHKKVYTFTALLMNLFYVTLLTISILILLIYFICGRSETTVIPCVSSLWYQAYTLFLFVFMFVIFVVSCFQTRRTPCGRFTTFPSQWDVQICPDLFNATSHERFNSTCGNLDRLGGA